VDLTNIKLDDFLVAANSKLIPSDSNTFFAIQPEYDKSIGDPIIAIGEGYVIHQFLGQVGDILLLYNDVVIGGYVGESLTLDPNFHGNELSIPMIIVASRCRKLPLSRMVSASGRAALTAAWKVANGQRKSRWNF
jgi:hypothetical protein